MEKNNINKDAARKKIEGIMGEGKAIRNMLDLVELYAEQDCPLLFEGETGVGKMKTVEYLHAISPRKWKKMVTIDCATLTESIIDAELFGVKKGAFTDAKADRTGKIEVANGSTLFFDNINLLSISMQHKLLRIIEERIFTEVGSNKPTKIDVRIVAAGNKKFADLLKNNRFCKDLYYRFAVKISVPNLKVRSEDVDFFIDKFKKEKANELKKRNIGIETEARNLLKNHSWEGNIRHLRNFIFQMVTYVNPMSNGNHIITNELVKTCLADEMGIENISDNDFSLKTAVKKAIERAEKSSKNRKEAIELLEITRDSYYNWKKKLTSEKSEQ
jgi:transcriptional regulator with PAS, ATPase and Fis domain